MKLIGHGNVSIHLLYPFLCPIASMIRIMSFSIFREFYSDFLFFSLVTFLAEIAGGSLMFLSYFRTKKETKRERTKAKKEEKEEENCIINDESVEVSQELQDKDEEIITNKFDFIQAKKEQIKRGRLLFYHFINAFLDYISFNLLSIICSLQTNLNGVQSEVRNGRIIFTVLLGCIFLKYPVYKHQKLSIALIFVGFIINLTLTFVINKFPSQYAYYVLGFIGSYIITTIQNIFEKYLMEKHRVTPYEILFWEGIFGSLIGTFAFLPSYFIPCNINICKPNNEDARFTNIMKTFESMKKPRFWIFIFLLFISGLAFNLFTLLTLNYYTPTHQSVSDALCSFMFWIYMNIHSKGEDRNDKFLYSGAPIAVYIIIIIGTLIYNEIIIFYFCGLEFNTRFEIRKRSINDFEQPILMNKKEKLMINLEEFRSDKVLS